MEINLRVKGRWEVDRKEEVWGIVHVLALVQKRGIENNLRVKARWILDRRKGE